VNHKDIRKKKHKKQWYVATLIIRCRVEDDPDPYTCDEQVRLIRARSPEKAYKKALKLGKKEEDSYTNVYGGMVYWEFVGFEDIAELESRIADGVEIRSRLFGHANPDSLVHAKNKLFRIGGSPRPEYRIINEDIPVDDD
jgi:Domain of unknown function (DUF4288)